MGGPSSEAPAAFNLVCMGVAVVKMLPKRSYFKGTATAFVHCGRCLGRKKVLGREQRNDVEDILDCVVRALNSVLARPERLEYSNFFHSASIVRCGKDDQLLLGSYQEAYLCLPD